MTNNRTDSPTNLLLNMEKVHLASRFYRLEVIPGQVSGPVVQLGWQERCTVHYRILPMDEKNELCLLSESEFSGSTEVVSTACVNSESSNYLCLERAAKTFMVSQPPLPLSVSVTHCLTPSIAHASTSHNRWPGRHISWN